MVLLVFYCITFNALSTFGVPSFGPSSKVRYKKVGVVSLHLPHSLGHWRMTSSIVQSGWYLQNSALSLQASKQEICHFNCISFLTYNHNKKCSMNVLRIYQWYTFAFSTKLGTHNINFLYATVWAIVAIICHVLTGF